MKYYDQLPEYTWSLNIVDTYEHLIREGLWMHESGDIYTDWLKMYFSCDLISAGLSHSDLETVRDPDSNKTIIEKWETFQMYLSIWPGLILYLLNLL